MKKTTLILSLLTLSIWQPNYSYGKFLNIYMKDNKYYMEVPSSSIGRDVLVSTTIIQGAAQKNRTSAMRFGYGGDAVFSKMVRIEKRGNDIDITVPDTFNPVLPNSIYNAYSSSIPALLSLIHI